MKVRCKCGRDWDYKGINKNTATCPDCRTTVYIKVKN